MWRIEDCKPYWFSPQYQGYIDVVQHAIGIWEVLRAAKQGRFVSCAPPCILLEFSIAQGSPIWTRMESALKFQTADTVMLDPIQGIVHHA